MWKFTRSLYNNHILIFPDTYLSRDDILSVKDITYEITGITEYHIYTKTDEMSAKTEIDVFMKMLENNEVTYIRNLHEICIRYNQTSSGL